MFGVYLFCAVLGGGLVLFSLVGGDSDDGLAEGLEAEPGAGTGASPTGMAGELLLGFFRVRNLTFLLAAFGVTGLLGHWLGLAPLLTAALATGLGLVSAMLVHGTFTWLRRTDSARNVLEDSDLEGSFARVVLPIAPGGRGRISCEASGQQLYLTARISGEAGAPLPVGAPVVILRMEGGVAEVTSAPSLELSSSND
jgi:membrane protein implicated in regulation of membrane protease activity